MIITYSYTSFCANSGFLKLNQKNDSQVPGKVQKLTDIAKSSAKKADVVLLVVDASLRLTPSYKGMKLLK